MRQIDKPAPRGWVKVRSTYHQNLAIVGATSGTRYTFPAGQVGLVESVDLTQLIDTGKFEQVV